MPLPEKLIHNQSRFWSKVHKTDECWEWTACCSTNGYGQFWTGEAQRRAHRVAYELLVGSIPEGLTLDHLCGHLRCVNPEHLEPVSQGENTLRGGGAGAVNARKTHCLRGHPFDDENTYRHPWGFRGCRTCRREERRRRSADSAAPELVEDEART